MKDLSCPSCGAPLTIKNRFVKVVTCDFCQQVSTVTGSGLDPTGKKAALAQLPSPLYVDALGEIDGRPFQVVGRLRYKYDAGQWDEWFLTIEEEQPAWLVEDEGTYTLYFQESLEGSAPEFENVEVGNTLEIGAHQVFITEKGEANIAGGEGQLAFKIIPGETVRYVDGSSGDQAVSLEYTEDEIEFLVGRSIPREALVIQEEDF